MARTMKHSFKALAMMMLVASQVYGGPNTACSDTLPCDPITLTCQNSLCKQILAGSCASNAAIQECGTNLKCDSTNVCRKTNGQSCTANNECLTTSACGSAGTGTCLINNGELCTAGSTTECAAGNSCVGSGATARCKTPIQASFACDTASNTAACATGLTCVTGNGVTTGVCKADDGSACTTSPTGQCKTGSECVDLKCKKTLLYDATCTGNPDIETCPLNQECDTALATKRCRVSVGGTCDATTLICVSTAAVCPATGTNKVCAVAPTSTPTVAPTLTKSTSMVASTSGAVFAMVAIMFSVALFAF